MRIRLETQPGRPSRARQMLQASDLTIETKTASSALVLIEMDETVDAHWLADRTSLASGALGAAAIVEAPSPTLPGIDLCLSAQADPRLLERDIKRVARFATARLEADARERTATQVGQKLRNADLGQTHILYVGPPHPIYLALEHRAHALGAKIAAASNYHLGFDHLHAATFDAIVLNAGTDPQAALSMCGAIRRNARLLNLPVALFTASGDEATRDLAIEKDVDLLGDLSGDPDSELAWLFERIRFARANYNAAFRLNAASAAWRTPGALCSRMVFTQHLAEMAVVANRYELPLSLLVFRVELPPGSGGKPVGWNMAVRQSADLIARMSRAEDLASVFPGDVIILGMPGAAAETARVAADRAASVAESTMFISSEDAAPVLIARFVCEKAAGEDGPSLLKRALTMSR